MSKVAANLSPLLNAPGFMLWHLLGAVLCLPAVFHVLGAPDPASGGYVAAFALPWWSAFVVASLQRDLLRPAFGFVLPGQRYAVRGALALTGAVTCAVAALTVLAHPGLTGVERLSVVWSAFCFGAIGYLLIVALAFLTDNFSTSMGLIMVGLAVLVESQALRLRAQELALGAPLGNAVALAALAALLWHQLGRVEVARRLCGLRYLSMQGAWSRATGSEFEVERRRASLRGGEGLLRRRLEERWRARSASRPALSLGRYVAGLRYELAGERLPVSLRNAWPLALLVLAAVVLVGYLPPRDGSPGVPSANAAYYLPCMLGMVLAVPLFTTMLLPVGRRERFRGALAIAGLEGLLVLGVSVSLVAFYWALERVAPAVTLSETVYTYRGADPRLVWFPLAVLPLSLLLQLTCRRYLLVPWILLQGTAVVLLVRGGEVLSRLGPLAIAVLLGLGWAQLVATIHAHSFRGDLVRE